MWERILGFTIFATLLASVAAVTIDITQPSTPLEPATPLRTELTTTQYGHHIPQQLTQGGAMSIWYVPHWNVTYHNIRETPEGIAVTVHAWAQDPATVPGMDRQLVNLTRNLEAAVWAPEDYRNHAQIIYPPSTADFPLESLGSPENPNEFEVVLEIPPEGWYNQAQILLMTWGGGIFRDAAHLNLHWEGDELVVGNERYSMLPPHITMTTLTTGPQ